MQFTEFKLNNNVLEAIKDVGYEVATPIQQKAIPLILEGRDLVGCAQTGTGKTAAFAIPIINNIHKIVGSAKKRKLIRTIVLTPTRELAIQIEENFKKYAQFTSIKTLVLYGGVNQVPQVDALKSGIDVLVTTPGRFLDLYKQEKINLDHVHQLVIDEADLMLDMGFIQEVDYIASRMTEKLQMLVFSATIPEKLKPFLQKYMENPRYFQVDPAQITAQKIEHILIALRHRNKIHVLHEVITASNPYLALIFTNT